MKIILGVTMLCLLASAAFAASFHWADRGGFHSADQITKVPLEHRLDLPMAQNGTSFPFTKEEDRDGAMYVWFMLGRAGADYSYKGAKDIPASPSFRKIDEPQAGDVAWWKGFVALRADKSGKLLTAGGPVSLKDIEKKRGKVTWYRYQGRRRVDGTPEKAPARVIKEANAALLPLDKVAVFPPDIKDIAEQNLLRKEWQKTVARLEELRKRYPDDPQVLRLLGVCYRMGHNLGMAEAWERAEAYLARAEMLAPEAPEAYISLGILYADTGPDYAELAEKQFRTALRFARKEQLPQIWWGLGLALYYQGKVKEALATVDRLIALHPEDLSAKKLRETILGAKQ